MNLPEFCIRRPAFTIVISLVLIILGLIGFMNLPVRWIPNVNLPEIHIITAYPGANARLVERDVTKVLEDGLSGINGIESLTSKSRQGRSQITVSFKLGRNMNTAVEDVRTSIERFRGMLPKDVENPMVIRADPDDSPILFLAFSDDQADARELSDYIDKYIKPAFETIDGMGSVPVYGERLTAMRIQLDPEKMAGAKVTAEEVLQLLREQNLSIPSGQIKGHDRYYSVITDTNLKSANDFNNLILRSNADGMLRLRDIGEASFAPENADSTFRINGKPAVGLGIIPQSTANPIEVEKKVQQVLANLKRTLPAGMQVSIPFNQVEYIRASMNSVYEAFIEAIIFVWIVILFFLNSVRATFIPIITIPVCLISSFALLYFLGFSINTITLMALVLAIGLVVDDAIVMLENIKRHMDTGMNAFAAALKGSNEIIFPIIAMTLTLAAVYAPIAFTPGLLGVLFREFTFTLAGAVIISGIVALTLSPMMCARTLNKNEHQHRLGQWFARKLLTLQHHYRRGLVWVLAHRGWVVGGLLLIILAGGLLYKFTPSELAPAEDMREIDVFVSAPRSASFQYTNQAVRQLEAIYQDIPAIESYLAVVHESTPSHSFQLLKLKPKQGPTEKIVALLNERVKSIPGVRVNASMPPPALTQFASSDEGDRLGLVVMTSGDYQKLQQVSAQVKARLEESKGFEHVTNRLRWDSEQFQINIHREQAADLNVPMSAISNTISTLIAGKNIGKLDEANIIVQMNRDALANPNILEQLYVRNQADEMINLASLVDIKAASAPEIFNHNERLRADLIFASTSPSLKLADAIKTLQTIASETIPKDMKYTFTGEAKSFLESNGRTALTFLLALIFIYLVLVAQFESFIDPLIILFTVPFAIVGALLSLKLFGGSLNVYSNIGLITLVGLIAKHGILITEFANRLCEEGQSIQEAVVEACLLRLRPILMTTAAMILGALPLALAFGPGAESRQQVGLVITGGLLLGTFFSLIIVPVVYTYLAPYSRKHEVEAYDAA